MCRVKEMSYTPVKDGNVPTSKEKLVEIREKNNKKRKEREEIDRDFSNQYKDAIIEYVGEKVSTMETFSLIVGIDELIEKFNIPKKINRNYLIAAIVTNNFESLGYEVYGPTTHYFYKDGKYVEKKNVIRIEVSSACCSSCTLC